MLLHLWHLKRWRTVAVTWWRRPAPCKAPERSRRQQWEDSLGHEGETSSWSVLTADGGGAPAEGLSVWLPEGKLIEYSVRGSKSKWTENTHISLLALSVSDLAGNPLHHTSFLFLHPPFITEHVFTPSILAFSFPRKTGLIIIMLKVSCVQYERHCNHFNWVILYCSSHWI